MEYFSINCYRKHSLKNQHYTLRLNDDLMTLTALGKSDAPKYSIELTWAVNIKWQVELTQILAFGFITSNKSEFKWFYGESAELRSLKTRLSKSVSFSSISDFYDSVSRIGRGASSQVLNQSKKVYEVMSKIDGKIYASKCIAKLFIKQDEAGLTNLHHELSILKDMNHPNIIKLMEFYEGENSYYIVMQLATGKPIMFSKDFYCGGSKIIQKIIYECLQGLMYLNEKGILHRDIKPDNIIYDPISQQVKLIDFGFATRTKYQKYQYPKCGTPGYAAPEVINLIDVSKKYSPVCDVFSLGCVFYRLLAKRDVFIGKDNDEILLANKECVINYGIFNIIRLNDLAFDLLTQMLCQDPYERITANQAIQHPFFTQNIEQYRPTSQTIPIDRKQQFQQQNQMQKFQTQQFNPKTFEDDQYFASELPTVNSIPVMTRVKGGSINENFTKDRLSIFTKKSIQQIPDPKI